MVAITPRDQTGIDMKTDKSQKRLYFTLSIKTYFNYICREIINKFEQEYGDSIVREDT